MRKSAEINFTVNPRGEKELIKLGKILLKCSIILIIPFFISGISLKLKLFINLLAILIILFALKIRYENLGENFLHSFEILIERIQYLISPEVKMPVNYSNPMKINRAGEYFGIDKKTHTLLTAKSQNSKADSEITFNGEKQHKFRIVNDGRGQISQKVVFDHDEIFNSFQDNSPEFEEDHVEVIGEYLQNIKWNMYSERIYRSKEIHQEKFKRSFSRKMNAFVQRTPELSFGHFEDQDEEEYKTLEEEDEISITKRRLEQRDEKLVNSIFLTGSHMTLEEYSKIVKIPTGELKSILNFDITKIKTKDLQKAEEKTQKKVDNFMSEANLRKISSKSFGQAEKKSGKMKLSSLMTSQGAGGGLFSQQTSNLPDMSFGLPTINESSGIENEGILGNKKKSLGGVSINSTSQITGLEKIQEAPELSSTNSLFKENPPKAHQSLKKSKSGDTGGLFEITSNSLKKQKSDKKSNPVGIGNMSMMMEESDPVSKFPQPTRQRRNSSGYGEEGKIKEKKDIKTYTTVFTKFLSDVKTNQSVTRSTDDEIKVAIKNFFGTICQELDGHFLRTLETLMETIVEMKNKGDEFYCNMIKSFAVKFIVDNFKTWKQNKVKCVYMTLVMRILSHKFPYVMEIFTSIILRKFPFIESKETLNNLISSKTKNKYSKFYIEFGFDKNPEIEKKSDGQVRKYYNSSEELNAFISRLECYATLYYGVLACDINYQLKDFPSFVKKHGLDRKDKHDYQYLFPIALKKILKESPVFLKPTLLRHWIMVSSDQWNRENEMKFFNICKTLKEKIFPKIEKEIMKKNFAYREFFGGVNFNQEVKNSMIGLKKELEEIMKNGIVGDKYVKFDPQYR